KSAERDDHAASTCAYRRALNPNSMHLLVRSLKRRERRAPPAFFARSRASAPTASLRLSASSMIHLQVSNEISEVLSSHRLLEPFGHEGNAGSADLVDVIAQNFFLGAAGLHESQSRRGFGADYPAQRA